MEGLVVIAPTAEATSYRGTGAGRRWRYGGGTPMSADAAGESSDRPVPSLARFGLSPDADLVYRALLAMGPTTGTHLSRTIGMRLRRGNAAVEELRDVGALDRVRPAGPRSSAEPVWRALAPAAIASMMPRWRRAVDTVERIRQHNLLAAGLDVPLGDVGPDRIRARFLPDHATVRQRIAELVALESREHLSLTPERAFSSQTVATALPLDRQLVARGVLVRMCGVPADDDYAISPLSQQLAAIHDMRSQYRERDHIPLKLMVFDREVALFPVNPLNFSAGALEIHEPAIVASLVNLFEQQWDTADSPSDNPPSVTLTPRERDIVGLLARGCSEEAVARSLGLSRRTISYALSGLMDRLGVDNRFQLGLALGLAHNHIISKEGDS